MMDPRAEAKRRMRQKRSMLDDPSVRSAIAQADKFSHSNAQVGSERFGEDYREELDDQGRKVHLYEDGNRVVLPGTNHVASTSGNAQYQQPHHNVAGAVGDFHPGRLHERPGQPGGAQRAIAERIAAQLGTSQRHEKAGLPAIPNVPGINAPGPRPQGLAGQARRRRRGM